MKRKLPHILEILLIGLLAATSTGCVEWLGAAGTGAYVAAEYVMTGEVRKTMCYGFQCTKNALLVALCRMGITAKGVQEIQSGEEIMASALELDIRIELKVVTPKATRLSVSVQKHFLGRDKATAEEIIAQTEMIAEQMAEPVLSIKKNARSTLTPVATWPRSFRRSSLFCSNREARSGTSPLPLSRAKTVDFF
jgi:hypothetical protein